MKTNTISRYHNSEGKKILELWEASVLATHGFLCVEDFLRIKQTLCGFDFTSLDTYCLKNGEELIGFMGLHGNKLEMLFLHPNHIGQGLGRTMMNYAIAKGVSEVDVNEQNINAVNFYLKSGFEFSCRKQFDDMGLPYPIITMKLKVDGSKSAVRKDII